MSNERDLLNLGKSFLIVKFNKKRREIVLKKPVQLVIFTKILKVIKRD
jgi:hypothetical protein